MSCLQAAAAAGCRYDWVVSPSSAGACALPRLLAVVDACLASDPSARMTVPVLLTTLTTLARELASPPAASSTAPFTYDGYSAVTDDPPTVSAAASAAAVETGAASDGSALSSPTPSSTVPVFDVLAVVGQMEGAGVAAAVVAAVCDAVGDQVACGLDVLKAAGVSGRAVITVRKLLQAQPDGGAPRVAEVGCFCETVRLVVRFAGCC